MTSQGRFFRWVSRSPKVAFWVTVVTALVLGIGIGGASATDQTAADQGTGDAVRLGSKADALADQLAQITQERDDLKAKADRSESRADVAEAAVKKLSAKGEVPDFMGEDAASARDNELVDELGWKIRTVPEVSASKPAGTVIRQSPREGKVLKSGRSITLIVARKPPPKPKQWVTIKTLQGDSSTKTEEFRVARGAKARLVYDMPQDGNNAITLYKAPKEYVDLLLNEIGPHHGSTRLYEPGTFYLDVTGAYTISVQVFKRPG